jgi:hypothetical protein
MLLVVENKLDDICDRLDSTKSTGISHQDCERNARPTIPSAAGALQIGNSDSGEEKCQLKIKLI